MILKSKHILIHLILSISFLMIPYVFIAGDMFRFPNVFHNPHDRFTLFVYFVMLGFFYFNYYYLLPTYYLKKQPITYFSIIAFILVFLITFYWWVDFTPPPIFRPPPPMIGGVPFPHRHLPMPPPISQLNQLLFLYIIGILVSLFARVNKNLKHIESERDKTALVYLKSQMNPHFIFNTFNSIYGLAVKEKADKTANGMLKLSDMLRYVLTDTQSDFVRLNKEINYINNYIELQKLRIESDTIIQYQITGNQNLHVIAPMLLIPFIENAFKYGINPGKESNIDIQIKIEDASLLLQVKNKIIVHNSSSEKMGIGIENTRNRLELLYPHKYILTLHETPTDYEVYLKIILT